MTPLWLVALAAFASERDGPRVVVSGALARPSTPKDASAWSELSGGLSWRGGRWNALAQATGVRRWDIADAQGEILVGFRPRESLVWEAGASAGTEERFLPSWSASTSLAKVFPAGWVGTLSGRWADYRGWDVFSGRLFVERYLGAWRLGAGVGPNWSRGLDPALDARISGGWDWSDAGGLGIDAVQAREAERDEAAVADRTSRSVTFSVRQGIGSRVVLRPSVSWTRLEKIHDRMEARLGLECRLGS